MGDGVAVCGIIAEYPELIPVIAVQSVLGAEPHESTAVLHHTIDRTLGQTILDGEVPETIGLS